jgi:hypothetical protein
VGAASFDELRARRVVLATGAQRHRASRSRAELAGVHLAMEYPVQQTGVAGSVIAPSYARVARGDPWAVGRARIAQKRAARGLRLVVEIAHGPTPPERNLQRPARVAVPLRTYPRTRRAASAVAARDLRLEGDAGRVQRLRARRVESRGSLDRCVGRSDGEVVDVDLVFVATSWA